MSCDRFACGEPARVGAYVGGKLVARVCSEACGVALIGPKRDAAKAALPASRASDSAAMRALEAATSALTLEARQTDTRRWEQMARAARMLAVVALARANEDELVTARQLHHALHIESRIDDPGVARQALDAIIGDLDAALARIADGETVDLDVHRARVLALRQAATDLVRLDDADVAPPGAMPDDQRLAAAHRQFPVEVVSTFKQDIFSRPMITLDAARGVDDELLVRYGHNTWIFAETGELAPAPDILPGDSDFLGNSWGFSPKFDAVSWSQREGRVFSFSTNLDIDQRQHRVAVAVLARMVVVTKASQAEQTEVLVADGDIGSAATTRVFSAIGTLPGVAEQAVVAPDRTIWLKMHEGDAYKLVILSTSGAMLGWRPIAPQAILCATGRGIWCLAVANPLPPASPYLEGFLYRLEPGRTNFDVDRFSHMPDDIRSREQFDQMKARQSADKARFTTVAQLATLLGKMAGVRARALSMTPLEVSTATLSIGADREDRDLDRLEKAIEQTRLAISDLIHGRPHAAPALSVLMQRMRATIALQARIRGDTGFLATLAPDVRRMVALRANPILLVGSFPTNMDQLVQQRGLARAFPRMAFWQGDLLAEAERLCRFALDGRQVLVWSDNILRRFLPTIQKDGCVDYLGNQWNRIGSTMERRGPDGTVVQYNYPLGFNGGWLAAGDYVVVRPDGAIDQRQMVLINIQTQQTTTLSFPPGYFSAHGTCVLSEGYVCQARGFAIDLDNGSGDPMKFRTSNFIESVCAIPGGFCTLHVEDWRYVANIYALAPAEFFSARAIAAALR